MTPDIALVAWLAASAVAAWLLRSRAVALSVLVLVVLSPAAVILTSRGFALPVGLDFACRADEADVLGSRIVEGESIEAWLQPAGCPNRLYSFPWSREQAEALQKAQREARENETGVKMRLPFEPSLDPREPRFYALPQPALPPKDERRGGPEIYQQPDEAA